MAQHSAEIIWFRDEQDFIGNTYSRRHLLRVDGGLEVPGSSSPQVVPLPLSDASALDPEEAFVASLSSCPMLWFLSIAAKRRFCVNSYHDQAWGAMQPTAAGKLFMAKLTLKPAVTFSGLRLPTPERIEQMHHQAHKECFIANPVKAEVRCQPVY